MIANPSEGFAPIDVERERARLDEAVLTASDARIEIHWVDGDTREALLVAMRRQDFDVFHFLGHVAGTARGADGRGADERDGRLVLGDGRGGASPIELSDLSMMLHTWRGLPLMVLETARGQSAHAGRSVARAGIPNVVETQFPMSISSAGAFVRSFYGAIAEGRSIDRAMINARRELAARSPGETSWGFPALYVSGSPQALMPAPAGGEARPPRVAP